jgi:hypothetical protein
VALLILAKQSRLLKSQAVFVIYIIEVVVLVIEMAFITDRK